MESELTLAFYSKGVCQICGIAWGVIIVSVIAEKIAYACALVFEIGSTEGHVSLYETFLVGRVNKLHHRLGVVDVAYAVEGKEGVEVDSIAYTALLRVSRGYRLVIDRASEISVVA